MTQQETNHLLGGLLIGGVLVFAITKVKNKTIAAAISAPVRPATPAALTTSDYGTHIIVANDGQLNTIVGIISPSQLTYHDFNLMIADPTGIMTPYSTADLLYESERATEFLNQLGWLDIYEQYESELPSPKIQDCVMFALNLGSGFRLLPPTPVVAAITAATPIGTGTPVSTIIASTP